MDSQLTIGLDFGSDSVRSVLVDVGNGEILGSRVHNYRRWSENKYCDAANSMFRQHPLDYLEGIEAVITGVLDGIDTSRVCGIGIDTTGSTPFAVDLNGTPLALLPEFAEDPDAMFILWKDHTALKEAALINEFAKNHSDVDYTMYVGGIYSSEWFWAKILHTLKSNEKVRAAAFSWVEHCDWIAAELTGRTDPLRMSRSRCAAGHKAMWHSSWDGLPPEEFFAGLSPLLAGLRERLFQNTDTAEKVVGTLSPLWAEKLGLSSSVVVSGGVFDCHAGAVGAAAGANELVKVFGTSTCDIIVVPEVDHCVRGICGQVDGSVIPGMIGLEAGQSAFGDIYAWFKRFLGYAGDVSIPVLEQQAAALPVDPYGILALDWFNGRRTPDANQHLRGALLGMNLGTTAPMVFRALVEATCCGARAIVERFVREGIRVDALLATGGISRKSPLQCRCARIYSICR
eukprot:TRINITY_DN4362_c0_g1_i2.p1 TRINITY_DN4362_c0_g1~~TRINITY_DN4362_c0_g1_i2.p1  ORF type:complete len:457 (-),score=99.27 TRINITY_DN4362_c0_g1_i2:251-1621(-)